IEGRFEVPGATRGFMRSVATITERPGGELPDPRSAARKLTSLIEFHRIAARRLVSPYVSIAARSPSSDRCEPREEGGIRGEGQLGRLERALRVRSGVSPARIRDSRFRGREGCGNQDEH